MNNATLRVALPKGRIQPRVQSLLDDCGYGLRIPDRGYRPVGSDERFSWKLLKAQNIASLVGLGAHDLGFTGHDWVAETRADVIEVLDLGFDPVRIVAAAPSGTDLGALRRRDRIVVASEYEALTRAWLEHNGFARFHFLRSYGATEVFPPEDADLIVDNAASGRTLLENGLVILDTLLHSTTRMVANPSAWADPVRRELIDEVLVVARAVLDARDRVLLEMNIQQGGLAALVATLPCMKSPTVAPLFGDAGFAVKVAVRRADVARLIPELRRLGATDILETAIRKVVA
ncbi:MAG: ATP phosphoribosyltransferase [Myxococcales bacterium]|nr:ATP phosphoribosyltransferase [Myxococcales bacterium]